MFKPDDKKENKHSSNRLNRTGEDIDMLHEHDTDPQGSDDSGSYHYKDNYDGA
jgi:hypothetical protein